VALHLLCPWITVFLRVLASREPLAIEDRTAGEPPSVRCSEMLSGNILRYKAAVSDAAIHSAASKCDEKIKRLSFGGV